MFGFVCFGLFWGGVWSWWWSWSVALVGRGVSSLDTLTHTHNTQHTTRTHRSPLVPHNAQGEAPRRGEAQEEGVLLPAPLELREGRDAGGGHLVCLFVWRGLVRVWWGVEGRGYTPVNPHNQPQGGTKTPNPPTSMAADWCSALRRRRVSRPSFSRSGAHPRSGCERGWDPVVFGVWCGWCVGVGV